MNRNQTIERNYQLAPYEMLKVIDTISGIPEELVLNKQFVNALAYLQLVSIESVAIRYNALLGKLDTLKTVEKIEFLEKEKQETITQLKDILHIVTLQKESEQEKE